MPRLYIGLYNQFVNSIPIRTFRINSILSIRLIWNAKQFNSIRASLEDLKDLLAPLERTVARTRQPLLEPDDDRLNDHPADTTNDPINRSIELNQSFNIGPSPNRIKASYGGMEAPQTTIVRMYSQRTAIENDSNQSEPSIPPPN